MRIQTLYKSIIRDIMKDHEIRPTSPGHLVGKKAGFDEVVQHTDHYIGMGNDEQTNARPDYRYRRYEELLSTLKPPARREAHVDLGCGAGLFSWVFLDWAAAKRLDRGNVELYGLDHCPAMIRLAREIRARLVPRIPNYPELRYCDNATALLQSLTENHRRDTDYTITFGHVLAQAHTPDSIDAFTRVIVHILKLIDAQSSCMVLAVDARNADIPFAEGWSSLLKSLDNASIGFEQDEVRKTPINDSRCARIASLYLAK